MWTWTSITPGRTTSPDASITFCARGAFEFAPIQMILPSLVARALSLSDEDDETATLPFLMTRSAELKLADGPRLCPDYLLLFEHGTTPRPSHWTSFRSTRD